MNEDKLQKLLWSIAIPGFGQLLNRKIFKGIIFIFLEFVINYNSNLNTSIMLSFNGKVNEAIEVTNYQWLLFYPCVYVFAMWDAVREAKGENPPFYYLPFVFGAYLGTVGIIYSRSLTIFTILLGPVLSGIIFFFFGIFLGNFIRYILNKKHF
ncbi:hypothetical protein COJ92_25220 [Priestia megaterium]|uniref:hypothetical protein n=1 Tax=Priestia megaterium TaxID=1404 RepID=UPI000BF61A8F|nr:hypothetical protein [Priestia megaterium]MED3860758.1 hypothetical protein [Priestia megaterium]MED4836833.1 hypothetical protein [Priestia megaterium]PFP12625.1 hypothetical protein COJ92_25220 [Priestia megaterium]